MKLQNVYLLAIASLILASCNTSTSTGAATGNYVQVERVARPAINEGLVISNANLNAWNEQKPSDDTTASGPGAEAAVVLGVVSTYATGQGLAPAPTAQVASGFLPDVMRIDTSVAAPGDPFTHVSTGAVDGDGNTDAAGITGIGPETAYVACLSATNGIPCAGRKLNDNVIQITLNYLANGGHSLETVPYDPGAQGPKALLGAFPYEAAPY